MLDCWTTLGAVRGTKWVVMVTPSSSFNTYPVWSPALAAPYGGLAGEVRGTVIVQAYSTGYGTRRVTMGSGLVTG